MSFSTFDDPISNTGCGGKCGGKCGPCGDPRVPPGYFPPTDPPQFFRFPRTGTGYRYPPPGSAASRCPPGQAIWFDGRCHPIGYLGPPTQFPPVSGGPDGSTSSTPPFSPQQPWWVPGGINTKPRPGDGPDFNTFGNIGGVCPTGYATAFDGQCHPIGYLGPPITAPANGSPCRTGNANSEQPSRPGHWNSALGVCVANSATVISACPAGQTRIYPTGNTRGVCVSPCPAGQVRNAIGACVPTAAGTGNGTAGTTPPAATTIFGLSLSPIMLLALAGGGIFLLSSMGDSKGAK